MLETIESNDFHGIPRPAHWQLSNGIRRHRILQEISQRELADACEVDQRLISDVEIGRRSPTLDLLRAIAKELGLTVPDLTETDSRAFAHRKVVRCPAGFQRRRQAVKPRSAEGGERSERA